MIAGMFLGGGGLGLLEGSLEAQPLLHYWNFNSPATLLVPSQTLAGAPATLTGSPAPGDDLLAGSGQDFAGLNAVGTDGAGSHLRLNNPLGYSLLLGLPTPGYENVVVRYETRRSGQGAQTQKIEYTTDGTGYTFLRNVTVVDGAPEVVTLDFSEIPAADNNPLFAIRIGFEQGAGGGTSGNNRFDNITVQGIVLPPTSGDTAPVLANPGSQRVEELATLSLQLQASDRDEPAQVLSYSLVSGPAGLTVSPSGAVSWKPTEAQGPGTYPVSVRVTDSGSPALSDSKTFEITVTEPDEALVHYWNFEDTTAMPSSVLAPTITPPLSSASLTVPPDPGASVASTLQTSFRNADDLGVNGLGVSGTQLRIRAALSRTMIARLPSTWVRDVVVRYRAQREGNAAEFQVITYTVDGTTYIPFRTESIPADSVKLVTLDFSAIPAADNNPNFGIRIVWSQGAGGSAGGHHFDNLTVHGRPLPVSPPAAGPVLSEVMSSNIESASDFEDNGEDWVEIHNPNDVPLNLEGYGLTDDPARPFKWVFPRLVLFPREYRVVFASEKTPSRPVLGFEAHAAFKIGSGGEPIVLTAPGGTTADQITVPALVRDVSYGRIAPSGSTLRYFKPATPGAPNVGPGLTGILFDAPALTSPAGFYTGPVSAGATAPAGDGVVLRYTLNGDEPTESSPILSAPVTLRSRAGESNLWSSIPTASDEGLPTQSWGETWGWSKGAGWSNGPVALTYKVNTFRVRAFKSGFAPSPTASGTYIVDPAGLTRYQVPVVSIMSDFESLFGVSRGLMRAPQNFRMRGLAWERPAHLEFFENGSLGFNLDFGIRIHGNDTRRPRLKSFRIVARSQYGADAVTYPLFPDHPRNIHERLILRSGGSDWYGATFRDAFAQSLYKGVSDVPIQYHRTAAVFINGEYWGIERFRDRYDNNYFKIQLGVDSVDFLETASGLPGQIKEGTNDHYFVFTDYLATGDLNAPGRYDHVKTLMDVENFRDFQIMETYSANADQPASNIQYWRSQAVDPSNPYADGRWRWVLCDLDRSFGWGASNHNRDMFFRNTGLSNITSTIVVDPGLLTGSGSIPPATTMVLRRMLSNLEFRQDFIIRFADLLNTAFEASHVQARLAEFRAELEPYMPEHIARWGYPRSMAEWHQELANVQSFAALRPASMRRHIQQFFNLGGTNRVTVNVAGAGGKVRVNTVTIGPGEPGVPPAAFPWSGIYFRGIPVRLTAVPEPGFRFSHWTGNVPAGQEQSATFSMNLTSDLSVTAHYETAPVPVLRQYWSFNDTAAPLGTPRSAVGAAGMTSTLMGGAAVVYGDGQNFEGSNAQLGEGSGSHLRVNNPLGAVVSFAMPTTGVKDVVVRLETRRSGQGAGTQIWEYTTDGTTFTVFRTNSVVDGIPALVTLDFSGVEGVDDNPLFGLRVRFERGSGGVEGNNRFDNITMHGVLLPENEGPEPVARTVWQIGTDDTGSTDPSGEFSIQNGRNDAAPGLVTRLVGDPQYQAAANPAADDDFYFAGTYPAGFNSLALPLTVPNDEPPLAWERGHTERDTTNRIHLVLGNGNVTAGALFRLSMEFATGGWSSNGVTQSGFGEHDMVIRFRNGAGASTVLYSQRISQRTNLVLNFPASAVQATAGVNTVEVVRTGQAASGCTYWIRYDYVRLESLPGSNTAPVLTPPGDRVVDELSTLSFNLQATDSDTPPQTLTYSLVSGPAGLTVSPGGAVSWTPTEAQGPGTYSVSVRVADSGSPSLSDTRQFTVTVNEVPDSVARTVWQIGTDDTGSTDPSGEFSIQNGRNDAAPGLVTRLVGDPQHNAAANPAADDDFYFAGAYPAGFNSLALPLTVPNDEPSLAWERGHTERDTTNRIHLVLGNGNVTAGALFRLSMEFATGGWSSNGVTQSGFGEHDMVIRFRNGTGVSTVLYSQRISQRTNLVLNFPASAVQATAGANTVEVVRTGPAASGCTYWIRYDYVRLESLPGSNTAPVLTPPGDRVVDELSTLSFNLQATDSDTPPQTLTYSLVSGPAGLTVSPGGAVSWTPTEAQGPGTYSVSVRVADSGSPSLSDTRQFTVTVNEVPDSVARTVWQIGTDNLPTEVPYAPQGEFSSENGRNDAAPGVVTRVPGDPLYNAAANPGADDDFYFSGAYPAGFNGLAAALSVPNDEPSVAWERAHTPRDLTNRVHFVLAAGQVTATAGFRLHMEFSGGTTVIDGVTLPGIGQHDMVIRFRNGAGVNTVLYSQRISQRTNLVLDFLAPAVQATAGANTIELVRSGPVGAGITAWILYDYLRLESLPAGVGGSSGGSVALSGRRGSGAGAYADAGLRADPLLGSVHNGVITVEGWSYLTLSFDHPEPLSEGTVPRVESSADLLRWSEAGVVELSNEVRDGRRYLTVQDPVPLEVSGTRSLRVRMVSEDPQSGPSAY